ncbi:MAG: hypothetical protein VX679_02280, partial [Pseudomonadota bacterium]|nr:hypothetical protein [Pseudomonadota bacterium]
SARHYNEHDTKGCQIKSQGSLYDLNRPAHCEIQFQKIPSDNSSIGIAEVLKKKTSPKSV